MFGGATKREPKINSLSVPRAVAAGDDIALRRRLWLIRPRPGSAVRAAEGRLGSGSAPEPTAGGRTARGRRPAAGAAVSIDPAEPARVPRSDRPAAARPLPVTWARVRSPEVSWGAVRWVDSDLGLRRVSPGGLDVSGDGTGGLVVTSSPPASTAVVQCGTCRPGEGREASSFASRRRSGGSLGAVQSGFRLWPAHFRPASAAAAAGI